MLKLQLRFRWLATNSLKFKSKELCVMQQNKIAHAGLHAQAFEYCSLGLIALPAVRNVKPKQTRHSAQAQMFDNGAVY
jgi:hypothetical protein